MNLELISREGYAIVAGAIDLKEVIRLQHALESHLNSANKSCEKSYAVRNALVALPGIRKVASSPEIRSLVERVLGAHAKPVRGLVFDKTTGANWKVAWH